MAGSFFFMTLPQCSEELHFSDDLLYIRQKTGGGGENCTPDDLLCRQTPCCLGYAAFNLRSKYGCPPLFLLIHTRRKLEAAGRIALPMICFADRRLAVLATPPWGTTVETH